MTVTDLLQVVPARRITSSCNKLLRACCHQLVNNLISDLLEQLVPSVLASSTFLEDKITCSRDLLTTGHKHAVRTHLVDKL